jgi:hypothetical protein
VVIGLRTVVGGQVSADFVIPGALPQATSFRAFFEPKLREFWLSMTHGQVEAGARWFPFKIHFQARDAHPKETILVVECEVVEFTARVYGKADMRIPRRYWVE